MLMSGAMIRPILLHPDPRLKKRAKAIGTPTAAHRALADDMLSTMYDAPGIGLAAPVWAPPRWAKSCAGCLMSSRAPP